MHDRARRGDLLLGDPTVGLRYVPHDPKRRGEEQLVDQLGVRAYAAEQGLERGASIDLVTDHDPQHGAPGTHGRQAQHPADDWTDNRYPSVWPVGTAFAGDRQ